MAASSVGAELRAHLIATEHRLGDADPLWRHSSNPYWRRLAPLEAGDAVDLSEWELYGWLPGRATHPGRTFRLTADDRLVETEAVWDHPPGDPRRMARYRALDGSDD